MPNIEFHGYKAQCDLETVPKCLRALRQVLPEAIVNHEAVFSEYPESVKNLGSSRGMPFVRVLTSEPDDETTTTIVTTCTELGLDVEVVPIKFFPGHK